MEQGVEFILQGRSITAHDIDIVKSLIISNPSWNRSRLSKELCVLWDWRRANGELKDIACRSLLRKLEQPGPVDQEPFESGNNTHFQRHRLPGIFGLKSLK